MQTGRAGANAPGVAKKRGSPAMKLLLASFLLVVFALSVLVPRHASAQEVFITPEMPFFELEIGEQFVVIERDQNTEATVDPAFAKTSRPCPPFCIHPASAGDGVETVGELEVLDFLREHVEAGTGHLVDSRLESWYLAGTIPGAINLPFNLFEQGELNPFLDPILLKLGATRRDGGWSFETASELLLFCNGPWCDQSPRAIRNLLALGYPPEKLRYYRGGMQVWKLLGLTVTVPQNVGG